MKVSSFAAVLAVFLFLVPLVLAGSIPGIQCPINVLCNGCSTCAPCSASCTSTCTASCSYTHAVFYCSQNQGNCLWNTSNAAPNCQPSWADCDGNLNNGCESAVATTNQCQCDSKCLTAAQCTATSGYKANYCPTPSTVGASSYSCISNQCRPNCQATRKDCDGNPTNGCEISSDVDVSNCGSCLNNCNNNYGTVPNIVGVSCVSSNCVLTCDSIHQNCDGNLNNGCETTFDSVDTCGSCLNNCTAQYASQTGVSSTSCVGQVCTIACLSGYADCDGTISTGCESVVAVDGVCQCDSRCGQSSDCTLPGRCVSDATTQASSWSCNGGVCIPQCQTNYKDCDSSRVNGCETDLTTVSNCGNCGNDCMAQLGPFNVATASCNGGVCGIATCNPGRANCDGLVSNGCESTVSVTDVCECSSNCGVSGDCNSRCATSTSTPSWTCNSADSLCWPSWIGSNLDSYSLMPCSSGDPSYGNCDNTPATDCEINLGTTVTACSSCSIDCNTVLPPSNGVATPGCNGGSCFISACSPLRANCDGLLTNGCESSVSNTGVCQCNSACSSRSDCLATGRCTPDGVTTTDYTCNTSSSKCDSVCVSGRGDCDGEPSNGCETSLVSTPTNCGQCGFDCATNYGGLPGVASTSCASSSCSIACSPGFSDCDGYPGNGCESPVSNNNCVCVSGCKLDTDCTARCVINVANHVSDFNCNGTTRHCDAVCQSGYLNCDGDPTNGCEQPTNAAAHCGSCNFNCATSQFPNSATATCSSAGVCSITCQPNTANCDNDITNGCETPASVCGPVPTPVPTPQTVQIPVSTTVPMTTSMPAVTSPPPPSNPTSNVAPAVTGSTPSKPTTPGTAASGPALSVPEQAPSPQAGGIPSASAPVGQPLTPSTLVNSPSNAAPSVTGNIPSNIPTPVKQTQSSTPAKNSPVPLPSDTNTPAEPINETPTSNPIVVPVVVAVVGVVVLAGLTVLTMFLLRKKYPRAWPCGKDAEYEAALKVIRGGN